MTVTLNVFVALLIAILLSIGLFLIGGQHEVRAAHALAAAEAEVATIPSAASRESVMNHSTSWASVVGRLYGFLSKHSSTEAVLARATGLRIALSARTVPIATFLLVLGAIVGLLRRDHAKELALYCSVTYSYVGKVALLGSFAYGVFVALSPFAPPIWSLYPAALLASAGTALYVGNLPPRI